MKLIKIDEALHFDNGTVVTDWHGQDCCEHVYADWDQLKDTDVMDHEFPEDLKIEGLEESGIKIDGYFVPCYNEQNGYYSNDLEIEIKYPNKKKEIIDITSFVEDRID